MISFFRKNHSTIYLAVLAIAFGTGAWLFRKDLWPLVRFLESDQAHPMFVVLAFLILPLLFFPVSALLLMIGLRFDTISGLLIMFTLMPVHLTFSYFLVRSVLRRHVEKLSKSKRYRRFQVPQSRIIEFSFLFMALPGMPYSVKNYLLPLTGIRFREYFMISWLVQGIMGIPFVVLGDAASRWSYWLFSVFLILFVLLFVISRKVRSRYDHLIGSGEKECG
jgi:uncharacterized membrane protein YdjX (TVP38/TMEM64 family)